ncbi:hypothetical protein [Tateyamaria pelophila]|uniref:hypothetical protein n=1 Tax=Tateyamaria pelophila TaxID=328415 RepID=UPI001CC0DB90|nr:hypothetical protein [Tateyamaria pelophila]
MDDNCNELYVASHARKLQSCRVTLYNFFLSSRLLWLRRRLIGPGALYNVGNLLALLSGIALQIGEVWGQSSVTEAIREHLLGSPGSVWLTGSMLIFMVSGELYHRAWQSHRGPDPRLTQMGDLVSGLAAIALTVALVWVGNAAIALFAGVLLAGGKLGSAILPTFDLPKQVVIDRGFRLVVVASRAPSIIALIVPIVSLVQSGSTLGDAILPTAMIVCFLLWLWADLLLLREGQVILIDRSEPKR